LHLMTKRKIAAIFFVMLFLLSIVAAVYEFLKQ